MSAFAGCQLLIDPPGKGAWNMAVDEVLLNHAAESDLPTLRLYQWQSPTLSLGYFQKSAERSAHRASLAADTVRRLSGGGAIVHDQELTYSLILPASHALSRDTQILYDAVHHSIIETLETFLTTAQSAWHPVLCEQSSGLAAHEEPFLCFQRRSAGDILLRKKAVDPNAVEIKIVGSAQRRRHGAVLQHGSVLLGQSPVAPELKGIAEITHIKISPAELTSKLLLRLDKHLCIDLKEISLPAELRAQARDLQQSKYEAANWSERR